MPKSKATLASARLVPARHKVILAVTSITSIAGMLAITGMLALATPAQAREIRWCGKMHGRQHTSCMYHTEQQCLASVSGRGGTCIRKRT